MSKTIGILLVKVQVLSVISTFMSHIFLNIGAMPGTIFYLFCNFFYDTVHSSGCSTGGYSFFLSWVSDSCIWANNFLPSGPREVCRAESNPRLRNSSSAH